MELIHLGLFFVGAYLAGSINNSLVVARLVGRGDVRKVGSGNPGATNTLRLLGKGWALVVLMLDGGRGVACLLLAEHMLPGPWQPYGACLGLVLGNMFPVFHGFKGGKGVATTLGLFFALDPLVAGAGVAIWLLVALFSRYASLSSICMVASYPQSLYLLDAGWGEVAFGCVMLLIVLYTHRENIGRLYRGRESKLGRFRPWGRITRSKSEE